MTKKHFLLATEFVRSNWRPLALRLVLQCVFEYSIAKISLYAGNSHWPNRSSGDSGPWLEGLNSHLSRMARDSVVIGGGLGQDCGSQSDRSLRSGVAYACRNTRTVQENSSWMAALSYLSARGVRFEGNPQARPRGVRVTLQCAGGGLATTAFQAGDYGLGRFHSAR